MGKRNHLTQDGLVNRYLVETDQEIGSLIERLFHKNSHYTKISKLEGNMSELSLERGAERAINWTLCSLSRYMKKGDLTQMILLTEDLGIQLEVYGKYMNKEKEKLLGMYYRALIYSQKSLGDKYEHA